MKKRILALAVILVMIAGILCSCADNNAFKSSEEDLKSVGACGDYDVKYQELRYLTMTYKELIAQKYGEDIFSEASSVYIGDYAKELERKMISALGRKVKVTPTESRFTSELLNVNTKQTASNFTTHRFHSITSS